MSAVFMQLNQFATNAIYLRDKTLASWIGSNVVTELSIAGEWPEFGEEETEIEFGDQAWFVTIEISATDVENLRRADVTVALADRPDRPVHVVSGLIEPPVPVGFPPVSWETVRQGRPQG
jgi:general secretion pathway protein I